MNTKMYDLDTDERFEGEDAADALFASLLVEPPKRLDERILSTAHKAIMAANSAVADPEWEELLRLEQTFDAMFAELMVEPPAALDQQIKYKAAQPILPQPTIIEVIINGFKCLVEKMFMPDGNVAYIHIREYSPALAADNDTSDITFTKEMNEYSFEGESAVEYNLPGECSLHLTSDFADPNRKYIKLFFDAAKASVYEGCKVELLQGNDTVLLSDVVEYGRASAEIPLGTVFKPPFKLQVFLQNVQE